MSYQNPESVFYGRDPEAADPEPPPSCAGCGDEPIEGSDTCLRCLAETCAFYGCGAFHGLIGRDGGPEALCTLCDTFMGEEQGTAHRRCIEKGKKLANAYAYERAALSASAGAAS